MHNMILLAFFKFTLLVVLMLLTALNLFDILREDNRRMNKHTLLVLLLASIYLLQIITAALSSIPDFNLGGFNFFGALMI